MRVLVVHPGATVSTADVFNGLVYGLKAQGVEVVQYSLHGRIQDSQTYLDVVYRKAKKRNKKVPKPTFLDVSYHASLGMFEKLLRFGADAILIISGVLMVSDVLMMLRRTRIPIGILMTESPYLMDQELRLASYADYVWTNERSAVEAFTRVQPQTEYLPHAWLPGRHDQLSDVDAKSHDVVFVGTGFVERIELLESVNWDGINLGLYGNWRSVKASSPLRPYLKAQEIANRLTAALYQHAKVGLNIYRTTTDFKSRHIEHAESLNPRAYELAASGAFHLSTPRAEVGEKFHGLVPTFTNGRELEAQVRYWLAHDSERQFVASQLPATVAADTWIERAGQVVQGLRTLAAVAA